jgi:hypothetical protein
MVEAFEPSFDRQSSSTDLTPAFPSMMDKTGTLTLGRID